MPAPGPGEVLVEVSHCGVCGSDLHMVIDGWGRKGSVEGHEWSGTVVAVGDGPRHAEEERSRPDGASVVGEVAHLDRSASDHVGRPERGDEALQIHHRPASLATAQDPPEGGRPEYASPVHGEGGPVTRPAFCGR